jgi:hypothetical protein
VIPTSSLLSLQYQLKPILLQMGGTPDIMRNIQKKNPHWTRANLLIYSLGRRQLHIL